MPTYRFKRSGSKSKARMSWHQSGSHGSYRATKKYNKRGNYFSSRKRNHKNPFKVLKHGNRKLIHY